MRIRSLDGQSPGRPPLFMVDLIAGVIARREIDLGRLGWIDERRASSRHGLPANRAYVDLRGFKRIDLDAVIEEEKAGYGDLEAADSSQKAIDEIDTRQATTSIVRIVDFGVAAAVVALSALGCVPITSCRGNSLGRRLHEHPAPMTTFYARRLHLAALMDAVIEADISIVNNDAKLEIYTDDLRKMHRFAEALRKHIKA
jgi:hypothetical protein